MAKSMEQKPSRVIPLQVAEKLICGDREGDYRAPEDSFNSIAKFWSVYLQERGLLTSDLKGSDISQMMVLLKISRTITGGPKADNFFDQADYTGLTYELLIKEGKLPKS